MRRFCELDPSPLDTGTGSCAMLAAEDIYGIVHVVLGGCKAHSNGKVKALPSTEDKKLYDIIVRCRDASFPCSVLLWKQHGLCILLFQDLRWVWFCGVALVSAPSAALPHLAQGNL